MRGKMSKNNKHKTTMPYDRSKKLLLNWKADILHAVGEVDWRVTLSNPQPYIDDEMIEIQPLPSEYKSNIWMLTDRAKMIIHMLAETGVRL
jgi:hypothetical protein